MSADVTPLRPGQGPSVPGLGALTQDQEGRRYASYCNAYEEAQGHA